MRELPQATPFHLPGLTASTRFYGKTTAMPRRQQAPTHSTSAVGAHPGGRPPKFSEPSRPVTLTLPLRTLEMLQKVHEDRARAIVLLADGLAGTAADPDLPPVDVVRLTDSLGLIVVAPSAVLRRIPFLHLVKIAPQRFIIALDAGHDFKALELTLRDALDDLQAPEEAERPLLTDLLTKVAGLRRRARVSMAEILLADLGPDD